MLTLESLRIVQDDFTLAADWAVPAGQVTAVMGPSGGGKSTLLQAISGFLPTAAGRVFWDGADLTGLPPRDRPISMLFQDNNLFPHLTAAQNVGLGIRPNLRLDAAQKARVTAALAQVGLAGMENRKPAAMSGGQQSRAALARVLVADRPLVLLDEPFAALGPGQKTEMLALVREVLIGAGQTVVMVTHDPVDARAADHVVVVADGVAAAPMEAAALFANPPAALREYLGAD